MADKALIRAAQADTAMILERMADMTDLNMVRMKAFARKIINDNPGLAECTTVSLRNAFATAAISGLYPDGKQAAITPFNNRKSGKKEATFMAGYHGLVGVALEHPDVGNVQGGVIYRGETADVEYGTDPHFRYRPTIDGSVERTDDNVIAAWATAEIKGKRIFFVMTRAEVDKIMTRAPGAKNLDGPWKNNYYAMAAKTAFKQLAKWFPYSRKLAAAIDADNAAEAGITQGVDDPEVLEVLANEPVTEPEPDPWDAAIDQDAARAKKPTTEKGGLV